MSRIVKLISLMIALILLLTGCSSPRSGGERTEPAVTLTALQYEIENIAVDFSNLWFFRQIEQQTGVHVDFTEVKDPEWNSSVSLAFAKGKMPDLILRGSLDVEEYGVTRHKLVPLDEYMDRGFLPTYTARMDEAGLREPLTASDGHISQLGFLRVHFGEQSGTIATCGNFEFLSLYPSKRTHLWVHGDVDHGSQLQMCLMNTHWGVDKLSDSYNRALDGQMYTF